MADSLFHFEDGERSFEDLVVTNGVDAWLEPDVMQALGYSDPNSFRKVIMRAMQACLSLGIMPDDNFIKDGDGYKLTRFACYLVAMNGDTKKPPVAAAQMYFASLASTYQTHLEHADGIDRLVIREEVKAGEKSLSTTAAAHGVSTKGYALFRDAGYRGMYNMSLRELKQSKGLSKKATVADHMGRTELAAHLFRITQTEAHISERELHGQRILENAARSVGASVRQLVIQNTGKTPEQLPTAEPINKVRTKIKGANKTLKKLDQNGKQ